MKGPEAVAGARLGAFAGVRPPNVHETSTKLLKLPAWLPLKRLRPPMTPRVPHLMHRFRCSASKRHPLLRPIRVISSQLLLLLLLGCGSSGGSSPTPKSSTTPSANAVDAAVLQAYRAESAAFLAAVKIPDPASAALAATAIDPLLTQVRASLVYDKGMGIIGRGNVTLEHPHVVSLSGGSAVVEDCVYSALILVYASSGQPVPGQPGGTQPEYDGVKSTVVLTTDGIWKVSNQTVTTGTCPLGY